MLESRLTSLEEPERANAVASGGVGERDAYLGETLPKVAFFFRPSLPAGLENLMGGEWPTGFYQTAGRDQRLGRRQRLLGDRLNTDASIGQRPPEGVTWPSLTRAP